MILGALAAAQLIVVCSAGTKQKDCAFVGNHAIQAAIDKAKDGDTILVRSGIYRSDTYRDVPVTLSGHPSTIRASLVMERKALTLVGEPGAIVDGSSGPATSALLVFGGRVTIRGLSFHNFRAVDRLDSIVDGYAIYVIDAQVNVTGVHIDHQEKSGVAGRGSSLVVASGLVVEDGYVGVMTAESSQMRVCNSVFRNNAAAGAATYHNSTAHIYNSVVEGSGDDGLYAAGQSSLLVVNSLLLRNRPFLAHVIENGRITVRYSVIFGNQADQDAPSGSHQIQLDSSVLKNDPQVDASWRLPAQMPGDPEVRDGHGGRSSVGLMPVVGCDLM